MSELKFSLKDDEVYAGIWNEVQILNGEFAQAERIINELFLKGDSDEREALQKKKVAALINGENPDDIKMTDWRGNFNKTYERRRLLCLAIEGKKRELVEQRHIASKVIVEKIKPQYGQIIKKLALQWIELAKVVIQERDMIYALEAADIAFLAYMPAMPIMGGLGNPRDRWSKFAIYLINAVESGYLTEEDIPAEWLSEWLKRNGFKFEKPGLVEVVKSRLKNIVAPAKAPDGDEWVATES